jgi:uncharacterized membrane protein SpoIIM required for sporulation
MQQELFEQRYQGRWQAFADWLNAKRKERGVRRREGGDDAVEIPRRYRELCQHLALARDRQYGSALVERLNDLVLRGHQRLYGARSSGWRPIWTFVLSGFPALVRARWRTVLTALLLLFGPLTAATVGTYFRPDFAYTMLAPEQAAEYAEMYRPNSERVGKPRGADSDLMAFGFYIANNVRIDFQCFAGGILFGVGAIFFLVYNGLVIGVIAGYITEAGFGSTFWPFVSGHSALELVGAALSGAAGLEIGLALVAPGRMSRVEALKARGRIAVKLLYGAATMTTLAAVIEGFWSGNGLIPPTVRYAVGALIWTLLAVYLLLVGRRAD